MKNTQGKWESHGRKVIVEGRWDDYTICECKCKLPSSHGVCYEKEEAKANAKLIASAPEMLRALQEICGDAWALDEIHPNELTRDRLYKMLKDIGMFTEKLIAKVEGK